MGQKAIAYLRISEDPNDKRLGVVRQREDAHEQAARLDAELVEIFEDNDISASTERTGKSVWPKVIDRIRRERPDYLIVSRPDRIGRRLADGEGLEELCRTTGTRVIAVEGGDVFANPAWPFIFAQAKMESMNTSARVRRAHRARRARGLPGNGGARPYGFEPDRVTHRPHEVAIIRDLASRVIRGEALWPNADRLREAQEPTVTGGFNWTAHTIRSILHNPRLVGDLTSHGEVIGKGAWEPILDRATWEALQEALPRVQREAAGPPAQTLLTGVLRCGRCLHPMTSNGSARPVYRCNRGIGGCGRVTRNRSSVDEYVTSFLLDRYSDDVVAQERQDARDAVRYLERERKKIMWRIDDASTAHAEGRLESREFYPLYDKMRRERHRILRQLATEQRRLEIANEEGQARKQWERWDMTQRRRWIRNRVAAVIIYPSGQGVARLDPATIKIELS